ncbi:hypothetical protein HS121_01855 [bacterium]|nr:hypothetical protein [bacterium]
MIADCSRIPDVSRFVLLGYSAAMMTLCAALIAFAYTAGWSRTPLFPQMRRLRWLTFLIYMLLAFVGYFGCQVMALMSIWYQTTWFDFALFAVFVAEDFFIVAWIICVIVYHYMEPPLSPDPYHLVRDFKGTTPLGSVDQEKGHAEGGTP